jgi:hypothetical protein
MNGKTFDLQIFADPPVGDSPAGDPPSGGGGTPPEGMPPSELPGENKPPEGGAPEAYEPFKIPEGFAYDETAAEEFCGVARELNLSQTNAQKLVDLLVRKEQAAMTAVVQRHEEQVAAWTEEVRKDREIGGARLDENRGIAMGIVERLGTPGLKKILVDDRLGNHPEVLRFLVRVGRALGEDRPPLGGSVGSEPTKEEILGAMYPSAKRGR